MPFVIEKSGPDIPDGTYTATLEKISEEPSKWGIKRTWHWLVEVGDKIESLSTLTSGNNGTGAATYKYLTGILGRAPQVGEEVADPIGMRCLLQLKQNEKGWPQIEAVLPFTEPQQVLPGVPR